MASKNQIQKLISEVQDPSDFPEQSEAPGLRLLDSALRCSICSELFDGPVSLKCGHCFCSLCIRQSLAVKQECPSCREEDVNEGHLRRNTIMEDAVSAWKQSRPHILQLLADDRQRNTELPRPSKRRRINKDSDEPEATEPSGSPSQELVKCPMCNKRVKYDTINRHLDQQCKDDSAPANPSKSKWDNILGSNNKKGKEREELSPLPKKSYDTLKDKKLRELLEEQDLPTAGDRKALVARHQRWVIMYNANLDKKSPKSLNTLRRELKEWETQQKNKTKHDVLDTATYQVKNKSEFDKLVEAARPKKPNSSVATAPSSGSKSKTKSTASAENAIIVDDGDES